MKLISFPNKDCEPKIFHSKHFSLDLEGKYCPENFGIFPFSLIKLKARHDFLSEIRKV